MMRLILLLPFDIAWCLRYTNNVAVSNAPKTLQGLCAACKASDVTHVMDSIELNRDIFMFEEGYEQLFSKVLCSVCLQEDFEYSSGVQTDFEYVSESDTLTFVGEHVVIHAHGMSTSAVISSFDSELEGAGFTKKYMLAHHSIYGRGWPKDVRATKHDNNERIERKKPNINLCMTTTPSRLDEGQRINKTIDSLANHQKYNGSDVHIFLALPPVSIRESSTYSQVKALRLVRAFPHKLAVVFLQEDHGPASRFFGCQQVVQSPAEYLISADDEHPYNNNFISALMCSKDRNETLSFSGYVSGDVWWKNGQSCDGLVFQREDLDAFGTQRIPKECFLVDDIMISAYLHMVQKPLERIHPECYDGTPLYVWQGEGLNSLASAGTGPNSPREKNNANCAHSLRTTWFSNTLQNNTEV